MPYQPPLEVRLVAGRVRLLLGELPYWEGATLQEAADGPGRAGASPGNGVQVKRDRPYLQRGVPSGSRLADLPV
jgi:hypothetical protein